MKPHSICFFVYQTNQKLTQEQKEHYKVRAKGKPSRVYHVPPKYTSQGIPIEVIEREQKELAEKKKYMEITIKKWVANGQLSNGSLLFLHYSIQ